MPSAHKTDITVAELIAQSASRGSTLNFSGRPPRRLEVEDPVSLRGVAAQGHLRIGRYSYIGRGSELRNVVIGRYCSLARRLAIGLVEHATNRLSSHPFATGNPTGFGNDPHLAAILARAEPSVAPMTEIGNDVWIGDGAFLRGGIRVGHGAVIAARAVVTRDVPPYAIVAGLPGRVIRYRFPPDIVERLLDLSWWDRDLSALGPQDYADVAGCLDRIAAAAPPPLPPAFTSFLDTGEGLYTIVVPQAG